MKKLFNNLLMTCIGLTTVTVGSTAVLSSCSCNKKQDDTKSTDIKVTFNPGEGRITSGNASINLEKNANKLFGEVSKPTVEAEGKIFTGWTVKDESGVVEDIPDRQLITNSLTVTANYVSASSAIYKTVTFKTLDGVTLSGNSIVAVKNKHPFFTVNRPVATKANAQFQYWATRTGTEGSYVYTKMAESAIITANTELYPVFIETADVIFGQPSGLPEGKVVSFRGKNRQVSGSTQYYETFAKGTQWQNISRAEATLDGYWFEGWYTGPTCQPAEKITDTTVLVDTTSASTSVTIYPHMIVDTQYYDSATFELNSTDIGASYDGATTTYFLQGDTTQFGQVAHPHAKRPGYVLTGWERALKATPTSFNAIASTDIIHNGDHIRPVFTTDIDTLLDGETQLFTNVTSSDYTVTLYPKSVRTDATYAPSITNWSGAEANKPTITQTAQTDNKFKITTKGEGGTFTLSVTPTLTTGAITPTTMNVTVIDNPAIGSDHFWVKDTDNVWVRLETDSLCGDGAITGFKWNGSSYSTAWSQSRSAFNSAVQVGTSVSEIPANFLNSCTSLTNVPTFPATATTHQTVSTVGDNFMYGCTSFNDALVFPNTVTTIGDGFLESCTTFNSAITMTNVTSIGSDFLSCCDAYNTALTLPTGLTSIGDNFMMLCIAFDKSLTIPESVTSVGSAFMYECRAYGTDTTTPSVLTINAVPTAFLVTDQTLAATSTSYVCYSTGYTIASATAGRAAAFKARFPDLTDPTGQYFRKLIVQA